MATAPSLKTVNVPRIFLLSATKHAAGRIAVAARGAPIPHHTSIMIAEETHIAAPKSLFSVTDD
jgi:hypothetical protein